MMHEAEERDEDDGDDKHPEQDADQEADDHKGHNNRVFQGCGGDPRSDGINIKVSAATHKLMEILRANCDILQI